MRSSESFVVYDREHRPVMMVAADTEEAAVALCAKTHEGAMQAINAYDAPLEDLQRLECIANITFIGVTMRMMQNQGGRIQLAH